MPTQVRSLKNFAFPTVAASLAVLVLTGCVSGSGGSNSPSNGSSSGGGSSGGGSNNPLVKPIDSSSRVLWLKLDGSTDNASEYPQTIKASNQAGFVSGVNGDGQAAVFKSDPADKNNTYIAIDGTAPAGDGSLNLLTAFTLEAWVKPTVAAQSSFILSKNVGWNYGDYALSLRDGAVSVLVGTNIYRSTYVLPVNVWTHVTATWDSEKSKLFVYANGILVDQRSQVDATEVKANDQPVLIGARNRTSVPYQTASFDGAIDDVKIYNVALDKAQVCEESGRTWSSDGECSGGAFGGLAPVGNNASFNVTYDASADNMLAMSMPDGLMLTGTLTASDADSDQTSLVYLLDTPATKGRVTISDPTTGEFMYMPDPMASGQDQFTFRVTDGVNPSESTATITINIARTTYDTDTDGINDDVEVQYGLDPYNTNDANGDVDLDSVTNSNEIANASDPTISDTLGGDRVLAMGFHEGAGLIAHDLTAHRNDGTLARPEWMVSPTGTAAGIALKFNGGDAITVADNDNGSLDPSNTLTISAWINPEETDQIGYIVAKDKGWNVDMIYGLSYRGGKLRVHLNNKDVTSSKPATTVAAKQWTHVTVTWDGSNVAYYINGAFVESKAPQSVVGPLVANSERLAIGARNRLGTELSEQFTGSIDQVQIWKDRVLNAEEVCTNYGGTYNPGTGACAK